MRVCELCDSVYLVLRHIIHTVVTSCTIFLQIIDVASSGDIYDAHSDTSGNIGNKRLPESTSNASFPVLKKSRRTLPKSALFSVQRGRGPEKPLIMPSPTHEHQVQD
jgi:hypothetical protein